MNAQEANSYIHSGGLKIYTTLDQDIQSAMDEVFTDDSNFPTLGQEGYDTQASMVLMDQYTGYVKALYGGYGEKGSDDFFNRATSSDMKRSPGSTIKPVAVYGPAIDSKLYTAASVIDDKPLHLNNDEPTSLYPTNDDSQYKGLLSLRTCLKESRNVPAMQIWQDVKEESVTNYLNKSGFTELTNENTYNSTALGGGVDTNPLRMAGAYTALSNNEGIYMEPILYTKVLDSDGEVIIDKTSSENENIKQEQNVVYTKQGAYVMTDLLQTVCESGTAAGLVDITNKNNETIPSAGKTGTTNENTDRWFVGYTPYYVGAVWYGDDNNKELPSLKNPSAIIWQKVMQQAHENLEAKDFEEPENIVTSKVCKYSGQYPSDDCQYDMRNDAITEEIFIKGTQPKSSDTCTTHKKVIICEKSTTQNNNTPMLATDKCPNNVQKIVSLIIRPEAFVKDYDSDPYPNDWIYEYNEENTCDIHNGLFDDNWDDFWDWGNNGDNNDDDNNDGNNNNKTMVAAIIMITTIIMMIVITMMMVGFGIG
jgi:penicillin-binding protein 1A